MNSDEPQQQSLLTVPSGEPVQQVEPELVLLARRDRTVDLAQQRIDRLGADTDLHLRLALAGFAGPDWHTFETELVRYGMAVLHAWIGSGAVFTRVRERTGIPLRSPDEPMTYEDAEDLAADTVATSLSKFRTQVLIPAKWDPRKGASLKTYWIGFCLLKYPDVYRRWLTAQRSWSGGLDAAQLDFWAQERTSSDPTKAIELTDEITRGLAQLPPTLARILELQAQGYRQTEIAELLEITQGSIESLLYRYRKARNAA